MQAKSRWSAHGCFLGLLLAVLFALVLAPVASASAALVMAAAASATVSLVMEAPTAGAVTGAAPTFSEIASRAKACMPVRCKHDMEDNVASSSAQ